MGDLDTAVIYANLAAVDAVIATEVGIVFVSDLGAALGVAALNGMAGEIKVETIVTFEGTYYGAMQNVTVFNPNAGGLIERSRARYTAGLGAWGAWSAWSLVDNGGTVTTPIFIQQTEPSVTGPAIWYQTDGSGNVIKKWIQTT